MGFRKMRMLATITAALFLAAACTMNGDDSLNQPSGMPAPQTESQATESPEVKSTAPPEDAALPAPSGAPAETGSAAASIGEAPGYSWGEGQLYVLAFLGYYPEDCSPNDWAGAGFFREHPELSGGAALEDVIFRTGDEYFYLLPRYTDAVIVIEEIDSEGRITGKLWESGWMPLAFGANLSDLYPNTRVTISCAAGSDTFFPMVSLADGGLAEWDVFPGAAGSFLGEWSMITPENEIYIIDFWEDGICDFGAGFVDSEFVWRMHGTYGIVGEDGTGDPPPGSLLLHLENVFVGYEDDEEALAAFEPYTFFAAYNVIVDAESDSMILQHLMGDMLLSPDTAPHLFTRR